MTRQELINMFVANYAMDLRDAKSLAIRNIELHARLMNGIVTFVYTKNDGSERIAIGTLFEPMLPKIKGTGKPLKEDLQVYFDIEKQSFRCFKKVNLLSIKN